MTETIESNNDRLRELISNLMELNVGAKIEIAGEIYIFRKMAGGYVVGGIENKHPYQDQPWKFEFDSIDKAIDHLIIKRTQDKIGLDFHPD